MSTTACTGGSPAAPAGDLAPLDTGLYRAIMDGRPGLRLFVAHPRHLLAAFDTATGGLYRLWRGPWDSTTTVLPDRVYYRQGAERLWSYVRAGDTLAPAIRYLGHVASTGTVEFRYRLEVPGVDTIAVRQWLLHDDHYGDHALETEFDFSGLDTAAALILRLGGEAGKWPLLWAASVGRLEGPAGQETYVQEFDGVGQVKLTFTGSADP